jgi:hypothetical protein
MAGSNALAVATKNREFDLRVLVHDRHNAPPAYTIGVWEGKNLRAICHIKGIDGALLAVGKELNQSDDRSPCISYPRWSEIAGLVQRLGNRADTDCVAAAGYLEDLHARLHNAMGELEASEERLATLGALIEEASSKAQILGEPDDPWPCNSTAIPRSLWFRLLGFYRHKQEGDKIYEELRRLREVAGIAAETLRTVDNWLGHASTREAAMEALWRLRRILESVGFPMPLEHLEFRGQIIRAMEESGVGLGEDGVLRLRRPDDKYWQPASGAPIKEILDTAVQQTS